MKHFTLEYDWLRPILPEGISVPSSTIISGPGGSGKPLIAGMFLASWLKQDGSLIYLLINSGREYAEKVFASCGVDGSTYKDRIVYIDFDPQAEGIAEDKGDYLKANLLKPDIWAEAVQKAEERLAEKGRPAILAGAALNILFFSPTYGGPIYQTIYNTVKGNKNCMFSVSNNVFQDRMERLESTAANLMFTHSEKVMELHLEIARIKGVEFSKRDIVVPLDEEKLIHMRSEADRMRKHLIPMIRKI